MANSHQRNGWAMGRGGRSRRSPPGFSWSRRAWTQKPWLFAEAALSLIAASLALARMAESITAERQSSEAAVRPGA
jgi:hypothetical protein